MVIVGKHTGLDCLTDANARLIVQAVNSHAALLAACEAWVLVETEMQSNHPSPDLALRARYRKEAITLTIVALAAAKEE